MEGVLSQVVGSQKKTQTLIKAQTNVLSQILGVQEDILDEEKKRNNQAKRDRFGGVIDLFPVHLHIDLPFGKRTFLNKLARRSGFYRLFLHKINPIDDSLFLPTQTKPKHLKMAKNLIKSVRNFFS